MSISFFNFEYDLIEFSKCYVISIYVYAGIIQKICCIVNVFIVANVLVVTICDKRMLMGLDIACCGSFITYYNAVDVGVRVPIPSIKLPDITNTLVLSRKVHSSRYCLGMLTLPSRIDISSADIFDVEM